MLKVCQTAAQVQIFSCNSHLSPVLSFFAQTEGIWSYLQGVLLRRFSEETNGVNVLAGPVFDHNHDGLRDTTESIREYEGEGQYIDSEEQKKKKRT